MHETDIAIVGAGPYGLAVASHLSTRGRSATVLGEPMGYWRRHMPLGMKLRSSWRASSIASPGERFSLAAYERATSRTLERPVPLADFLDYGDWYRQQAAPELHERRVVRVTVSPTERLRTATDKRRTSELAATLGIPQPRTWAAGTGPPELPSAAFPVIVKPAYRPRAIASSTPKAWPAASAAELALRWDQAAAFAGPGALMVQERIAGGGDTQLAYGALCRDGDVLASIVARRTRQRPMDFGLSSTFVESISDPEIEALAERWLAASGLTGLVEVEFKRPPGGPPMLLDVNPRAWGWISLGARAGVDFPWLLWQMAHGESLARTRARTGVRWMRPIVDGPTSAGELLHGRLAPRAYLASWRPPLDLATVAADDLAPALREPFALARLKVTRARAARAARSARRRRP